MADIYELFGDLIETPYEANMRRMRVQAKVNENMQRRALTTQMQLQSGVRPNHLPENQGE